MIWNIDDKIFLQNFIKPLYSANFNCKCERKPKREREMHKG